MRYPSDLTDPEWNKIRDFFQYGNYGNRSTHSKRELVNAIRYMTKTGCQWRQLPKDFAPWPTVHSFFRRAKIKGIWEKMLQMIVKEKRQKLGRSADPTYAIIDSQSVKTSGASDDRGIDGGKKNKGT